MGQLGATHAGAIERHQQGPSKQYPGGVDQTRDFLSTKHSGQSASVFGIGQEVPKLMSLERLDKEEPQRCYTVHGSLLSHSPMRSQQLLVRHRLQVILVIPFLWAMEVVRGRLR